MENELKNEMLKKNKEVADLMTKVNDAHCSWWSAVLSVGINCLIQDGTRAKLQKAHDNMKDSLDVVRNLKGKTKYFDNLAEKSAMLTSETTKMLEEMKKFDNTHGDTLRQLKEDFTDEQIRFSIIDPDFS